MPTTNDLIASVKNLHDEYFRVRPAGVPFPAISVGFFCTLLAAQRDMQVNGDVLEIGVEHGGSSLLLLTEAQGDERVNLMDLVRSPRFDEHFALLSRAAQGRMSFFLGKAGKTKHDLPRTSDYRFIHIDGGHAKEDVLQDIANFALMVGERGVVCLDDVFEIRWPGVTEAVLEALPTVGLKPFAFVERKLYVCRPEVHADYLIWLRANGDVALGCFGDVRSWVEPFLGAETWIAKMTPNGVALRAAFN